MICQMVRFIHPSLPCRSLRVVETVMSLPDSSARPRKPNVLHAQHTARPEKNRLRCRDVQLSAHEHACFCFSRSSGRVEERLSSTLRRESATIFSQISVGSPG